MVKRYFKKKQIDAASMLWPQKIFDMLYGNIQNMPNFYPFWKAFQNTVTCTTSSILLVLATVECYYRCMDSKYNISTIITDQLQKTAHYKTPVQYNNSIKGTKTVTGLPHTHFYNTET